MGRTQFVVRRCLQLVVTLWAVATALFFMFRSMPGDPTVYIIDNGASQATRERLIESYGLSEPLYIQYLRFIENILTLDFGVSFHTNESVRSIIFRYLPRTLILMLTAFVLAYTVGIIVGVLAGWKRGSKLENGSVYLALTARSFPAFFIGLLVLWIFGAQLELIPMAGINTSGVEYDSIWSLARWVDTARHLIAPASVLGFYLMGYPLLLMRSSMIDVLGEDFIEVARARGLKDRAVMFKHAARNALLPVVTAGAVALGYAVGGSVLIETVFGWPGLGRQMVNAVIQRDYPVAQGMFFVFASSVIILNFIADIAYGFLDPRVSYD